MTEQKCGGDHSIHFCAMAGEKKFEEMKPLARNPKYICYNCGRVADEHKNLCNPKPIE